MYTNTMYQWWTTLFGKEDKRAEAKNHNQSAIGTFKPIYLFYIYLRIFTENMKISDIFKYYILNELNEF